MLLSLVVVSALSAVEAAPPQPVKPAPAPAIEALQWTPWVDLPVTAALAAGMVLTDGVFKERLAPSQCRWCSTNRFDSMVRKAFHPTEVTTKAQVHGPDMASNVIGFGLLPAGLVLFDVLSVWDQGGSVWDVAVDVLLISEALLTTLAVTQITKCLAGRARPFTFDGGVSNGLTSSSNDQNLSFFSGHTSLVFAAVSAAGTVATLRGYKNAWLVWTFGGVLAASTGVLRIAADKHWATDVLLGLGIGAAVGVLEPLIFHRRIGKTTLIISPMGAGLQVSGNL